MPRRIALLLQDIIDYGSEARDAVGPRDAEAILAERFREHTVLRTVQIVGEASAQILRQRPEGFPSLDLREAAGLRNILVHGYIKTRMDLIVKAVRESLPALIAGAQALLEKGDIE